MQKIAKQNSFNWSTFLELKSPIMELFLGGLKEVYWAENHLVRVLLKMTHIITSRELHRLLDHHMERTKIHAAKLEHIFELLDEIIDARRSNAVAGLSAEVDEMIEYTDDGTATRDIGIILVNEKIEQYEIASYSALIRLAEAIGREDVAEVLKEILADETESFVLLSNLSEAVMLKAVGEN